MGKFNNNYEQPEDSDRFTSKFNEAFLKMHRIHKLQDSINLASLNPLQLNPQLFVFNYEIIIRACDGILKECWAKMTPEERTDAVQLKEAIELKLESNPIHFNMQNKTNNKEQIKLNLNNWNVLKKWIFKYEVKTRELLGKTGYDSPDKDSWDEDEL